MKIYRLVLFIAMTPFFMGCASKAINPEDFSIEGQIYDLETDEVVPNVEINVNAIGWSCPEASDEDGIYIIDDDCLKFKKHLSNMNLKEESQLDFSIQFDHEDYRPTEISLTWSLDNNTFVPPEIYLEPVIHDLRCPIGKFECIDHPSGCCRDCPPRTYWKMENGEEICKSSRIDPLSESKHQSQYLQINVRANQATNLSFGVDGFPPDETEEMELAGWDESSRILTIIIVDDNRSLEINCIVENEDYRQRIEWPSDATAGIEDELQIKWDNEEKMFTKNWGIE